MSSPPFSLPNIPPQGRKIAPLPLRARSTSSGTPGSSQDIPTTHEAPSHDSSSGTSQSLSAGSTISQYQGSYQSPDTALSTHHLPPPARDGPGIAFQSSQPGSNSLSIEPQETSTFRLLHNITPRPSSEPEQIPRPSSQGSPAGLTVSSLPTIATPDHGISQPLHTLYSDEKIAIPGTSETVERGISTRDEVHSDTTPQLAYPMLRPPPRQVTLLLYT